MNWPGERDVPRPLAGVPSAQTTCSVVAGLAARVADAGAPESVERDARRVDA